MKSATILICVALISMVAQARLGETKEQMTRRYGRPTRVQRNRMTDAMWFKAGDFEVYAAIPRRDRRLARIAEEIHYIKMGEFPIEQALHFLNMNSQGHKWRKVSAKRGELLRWSRSDGGSAYVGLVPGTVGKTRLCIVAPTAEPESSVVPPPEGETETLSDIGARLGWAGNNIIVKEVLPDSSAKEAGLPVGARLVSVNGRTIENMSLAEVGELITGRDGTTVALTVAQTFGVRKTYRIRRRNMHPVGPGDPFGTYQERGRTDVRYFVSRTGDDSIEIRCPERHWAGTGMITDNHIKGVFRMETHPDVESNERGAVGYFHVELKDGSTEQLLLRTRFDFLPRGNNGLSKVLVRTSRRTP